MKKIALIIGFCLLCAASTWAQKAPRFKVIALYENGGHHIEYSKRAKIWLDKLAADSNFTIDYIQNTDKINDAFLANYQLFIQLDYAPYGWKPEAVTAFQNYIEQGKGGWIGFHHATLLGEFDGYPMWDWFSKFMGNTRYKNYIATFVKAKVNIEDKTHPVMKGVSPSFIVEKEEFYTYEKSMRDNVHVLASVDESTYEPSSDIKMGDHPVVWTNPNYKARNIYIFMGHSPVLFESKDYKTLFSNAIFWAAGKRQEGVRKSVKSESLKKMMIKKLIIALSLLPCICMAQSDPHPVTMQMQNGKIYFDNAYSLNASLKKDELFNRAANWLKGAFQYPDKSIDVTDSKKGEVAGHGVFKIITSGSGHYYWLKFAVNIVVHNATYELKLYDFYEKPIEPGISNEYSKIEYRWWDYRQGKPWGPEDKPLFEGMDKDLNEMMVSLQSAMSK